MAPIAKATIVNSSLARNYVAFGSEIALYGTNLDLADRVTITDSSSSPSFQFRSTNFVVVNSTEIRVTLPQRVEPSRTFTNNTWYEINVNLSTTSDSNYLGIFLYEAQPFDGSDGNIPCSQDGFVSVSAKILNSNTVCTGSLVIPEGVISIGNSVFYSTTTLTSVSFPSTLTVIGVQAFGLVTSLTNVNLVEGLTSISYLAFVGTHLTAVEFPNSLTTIGESAFEQTMLSTASFGSGLHTIESKAFKNTNLTNITIPSSVTTIGDEAFQNIETLQSIEYCWPSGILAVDVLNGLEYVDLICNQRTTIEVTNLLASGSGSLTEAITQIAASDVQDSFQVILPAGTINVADGFPEITRDTEIRGQGSSSILNLIDFGTNIAQDVLFKTNRTSVDLVLNNIVVQGTIASGSLIRNDQGFIQVLNSSFKNITTIGSEGLIENYADQILRLYSTITIQDSTFQNITGSRIFHSDFGYTPSTSTNDADYNNKIYSLRNTFDNVTNIAGVQRFLKFDNSIFKNSIGASISSGNNRFQLLNSTFESDISLNIGTAWDPITGYATRSGVTTSLTALEKVISGNTFKNVSTLSSFISLDTGAYGVGIVTVTNNNFQFISNSSPKSPELSDLLFDANLYTAETVFAGNRYFYPSTLIFNGNQSTSGSMSNSVGVGTGTLPSNQFVRSGFSFYGWNTQADGLGSSFTNQAAYTYGVDQTLYAIWTKNPIVSDPNAQSDARLIEERARQARELQELLTVLPSIGKLALEIGKLIENLTIKKCVKGKKVKNVKAGAKCPKGYKVKK